MIIKQDTGLQLKSKLLSLLLKHSMHFDMHLLFTVFCTVQIKLPQHFYIYPGKLSLKVNLQGWSVPSLFVKYIYVVGGW